MQRVFDLAFSIMAMVFLFPFLIFVIIILSTTGEKEIFFTQDRIGKDGRVFKLIKFATMLKNSPQMATGTITVKQDKRILPFGKFLRLTKINELPQLINVLRGEMSLIGPRPLTQFTFMAYSEEVQKEIIKVSPGLSGVGSILFRDEEALLQDPDKAKDIYSKIIAPHKGKLEVWYVENRGLKLYFQCIFLTIIKVIFPKSRLPEKILMELHLASQELDL